MLDASEIDAVVRYWEGAIRVRGRDGSRSVLGRGFLEMTGYDPGARVNVKDRTRAPLAGQGAR